MSFASVKELQLVRSVAIAPGVLIIRVLAARRPYAINQAVGSQRTIDVPNVSSCDGLCLHSMLKVGGFNALVPKKRAAVVAGAGSAQIGVICASAASVRGLCAPNVGILETDVAFDAHG